MVGGLVAWVIQNAEETAPRLCERFGQEVARENHLDPETLRNAYGNRNPQGGRILCLADNERGETFSFKLRLPTANEMRTRKLLEEQGSLRNQ